MERTCPVCNKQYEADETRLKYGRQTTCSRACSYKMRAVKLTKKIIMTCPVCNKAFSGLLDKRTKSNVKFCSKECAYKARSLGIVKRVVVKPYNTKRRESKTCLYCGKQYHGNSHSKYCSRTCFEKSHITTMKGAGNPSYIDGRSKNKKCYRGDDWDNIRKEVYKRDNYKCQICGKHCGRNEIQCHHIKKYRNGGTNELDNLMTVCNKCHPRIEKEAEYMEVINRRLEHALDNLEEPGPSLFEAAK